MLPRTLALVTVLLPVLVLQASGEPRRWAAVLHKSAVFFEVRHPLGDFTGRGEDVSGEFEGDIEDLKKGVTGSLRVNPTALKTVEAGRDKELQAALDVKHHPDIRYTIDHVDASFNTVTPNTDVLLTIRGRLLIHGVERPVTFPGRIRLRDEHLWVRGESRIKMSDFGIKPPRRFLLAVKDELMVYFDLTLGPAR